MKYIYIINPVSGKKRVNSYLDIIEEVSNDFNLDYEVKITERPCHAKKIASQYTKDDNVILCVFGGDGTVHEVIEGINQDVTIAIIPVGTGNDFYRYFNVDISNPKKLLIDTIKGNNHSIDIGTCNDTKFINCFSMGFDAEVSDQASKMIREKKVFQPLIYPIAAISNLIKANDIKLSILIDDDIKIETTALICAINNGRYYGGGFLPTPKAFLNDNKLDFCLIEKLTPLETLALLPKFMTGKHLGHKKVKYYQFEKLNIIASEKLTMEMDGETIYNDKAEVKVLKNYINLRLPDYCKIS